MADAKLTVHGEGEAPAAPAVTASTILDGAKTQVLVTRSGSRITVRKPSVLDQFDLVEAVGPEVAANQAWMQMVQPLLWVGNIDGDPVGIPLSKNEVRALIQRLGEDGMDTLNVFYMVTVVQPMMDEMETLKRQQADEARAKN